jgi:hypothetical protein
MKIPLTPAGIEPATYRFVAQHSELRTDWKLGENGKIWKFKNTYFDILIEVY